MFESHPLIWTEVISFFILIYSLRSHSMPTVCQAMNKAHNSCFL